MSIEQIFAAYFKPEIQKRGREDFKKGKAFISSASDTQIHGLVKSMPANKVCFQSNSISSPIFSATCTCSLAAKGAYCKHMWTLLLATQDKHPDFLDSKKSIEKNDCENKIEKENPSPQALAYKEKQTALKKQLYEKQKAWAKEKRLEKKRKELDPKPSRDKYPNSVEQALVFFTLNGFNMTDLPSAEELKKAKKLLARVFHPDKGGSHEESVILNQHFEVLIRFIIAST